MNEKVVFSLFFLLITVLDACGDGLRDRGLKTIGGVLEASLFSVLFLSVLMGQALIWSLTLFLDQVIFLAIAYVCFRFAFFNVIYELSRGNLNIFYIGTTKIVDRIYTKFIVWLISKPLKKFKPPEWALIGFFYTMSFCAFVYFLVLAFPRV